AAGDDDSTPTLRPEALLLDFGGVVFSTHKRPEAGLEVARIAAQLLARAGHHRSPDELASVFAAGGVALRDWKNSQSRLLEPTELAHRPIWRAFHAAPLPAAEREVLIGHAGELQRELTIRSSEHTLRPGLVEPLDTAAELGVPVGIVAGAHSGRAPRAILDQTGLTARVAGQPQSDEVGIRAPPPGSMALAAPALRPSAAPGGAGPAARPRSQAAAAAARPRAPRSRPPPTPHRPPCPNAPPSSSPPPAASSPRCEGPCGPHPQAPPSPRRPLGPTRTGPTVPNGIV